MQLTVDNNFPADFFSQFDSSWTLFLDRDGVINHEQEDDYIRNWESFHFIDGVLPSFTLFAQLFEKIFIVTNQKGVGKGLMTEGDLQKINDGITHCVNEVNGFITKIYYCTAIDNASSCRKPNNGMAIQAQREFPSINFSRSIMIGNTMGDMQFGKSLGMLTIFIASSKPTPTFPNPLIDLFFPDLYSVAKALQNNIL
jgi:histidinol-phosphate phosphatase family protein